MHYRPTGSSHLQIALAAAKYVYVFVDLRASRSLVRPKILKEAEQDTGKDGAMLDVDLKSLGSELGDE